MVLNWSIEAAKWKYLIGKVEQVSFGKALQAVLTGISVSSFIPNRVGEFFGRVFILKTASRIEGILITFVGSISQLLITILAGSLGLMVFIPQYLSSTGMGHGYLLHILMALIITLDLILLALFFKISILNALKDRILRKRFKWFRKFFRVFGFFRNCEMSMAIFLSASRYLVFSTQYYMLLQLFNVSLPYPDALMLISIIYLILTVIPTVALTELGVRGSVALYIFGLYYGNYFPLAGDLSIGIFAASTILWVINLALPALVGTVFIFRLQFFRKTPR